MLLYFSCSRSKELRTMKKILVNGAGGFIGGHLVKKLKAEGHWVRAVDLKQHEFVNAPGGRIHAGRPARPGGGSHGSGRHRRGLPVGGGYGRRRVHFHRRPRRGGDAQLRHHQSEHAGIGSAGRGQAILLFLFGMHLPGVQPARSAESQVLGRIGVPGGAGQRVRLGEAIQRTPVFGLCAQSRNPGAGGAIPQYFWTARHLDGRPGESACGALPQSGGGARWWRNRDLGRWVADAIVPVCR